MHLNILNFNAYFKMFVKGKIFKFLVHLEMYTSLVFKTPSS